MRILKSVCYILAITSIITVKALSAVFPLFSIPPNSEYKVIKYVPIPKKKETKIKVKVKLTISAVFIMGDKKAVLIGTKIYTEGDRVNGMVIKKITLNKVVFKKGDDDYEVSVEPESHALTIQNGEVKQN